MKSLTSGLHLLVGMGMTALLLISILSRGAAGLLAGRVQAFGEQGEGGFFRGLTKDQTPLFYIFEHLLGQSRPNLKFTSSGPCLVHSSATSRRDFIN